ncbi:predicted protein [Naegleria gruberi]|uniref:Predicted protein n=1 Tax=Naegleria gruberi TaxID=5762 RepID=D2VPQ8_NAEGR|nr:uncharacterized protein NAEGRDRAFT_70950 [Naegleria gruberi]EFC41246.1 predicted protein [Naegleria gruberi]|eukprot:XP_002673990.1 predicted protein [Naegleria gruberi strain NEG-M]
MSKRFNWLSAWPRNQLEEMDMSNYLLNMFRSLNGSYRDDDAQSVVYQRSDNQPLIVPPNVMIKTPWFEYKVHDFISDVAIVDGKYVVDMTKVADISQQIELTEGTYLVRSDFDVVLEYLYGDNLNINGLADDLGKLKKIVKLAKYLDLPALMQEMVNSSSTKIQWLIKEWLRIMTEKQIAEFVFESSQPHAKNTNSDEEINYICQQEIVPFHTRARLICQRIHEKTKNVTPMTMEMLSPFKQSISSLIKLSGVESAIYLDEDFSKITGIQNRSRRYDHCFFCDGYSSAEYRKVKAGEDEDEEIETTELFDGRVEIRLQFDSCHRKFNLELRTFFEDSIIVNDEPEDHVDETEDDNEEDDDVMDYDEDEDDEESDDEDDEPTKLKIKLFY